MLRERGSGTLDAIEMALSEKGLKLSSLNVRMYLGSTESIKLFLENMDAVGIVSIRAVTRELMAGRLKVIDVDGLNATRMFSFVMPQGPCGGVEESFMRYTERQGWSIT